MAVQAALRRHRSSPEHDLAEEPGVPALNQHAVKALALWTKRTGPLTENEAANALQYTAARAFRQTKGPQLLRIFWETWSFGKIRRIGRGRLSDTKGQDPIFRRGCFGYHISLHVHASLGLLCNIPI